MGTCYLLGSDNPTGFWEDADVMQLNDKLLDTLDLRWDMPSALPLVDFSSSALRPLRSKIRALLKVKMANSRLFAIKDPRICLLLPIWLEVAASIGIRSKLYCSRPKPFGCCSIT